MTALDRAESLAEVNRLAAITQNLELDVLGVTDELLKEDSIIAECRCCPTLTEPQRRLKVFLCPYYLHPDSTTSRGSFDDKRETDLCGELGCLFRIGDRLVRAPRHRDTGL